jgi:type VI secretion system Hcp family effector|tara:strand:+ start:194 stop:454 length:261 start_codon:yes stop_codon:yes gene_type:complete
LFQALCENHLVNSAEFRFYRPSGAGGAEENFYTVTIHDGHVSSVSQISDGTSAGPPIEQVTFTFQGIEWTYGNVSHQDSVGRFGGA